MNPASIQYLFAWNGTNFRPVLLDEVNRALVSIPPGHHEVHEGDAYYCNYRLALGNGDKMGIGFTTPDTAKLAHVALKTQPQEECVLDVYRDCTSLSGGASFTTINQHHESSNTSGMTVIVGGTGSNLITRTGGDNIFSSGMDAGTPVKWVRSDGEEQIFKRDSIYYFEITNDITAQTVALTLHWYEHTDKTA